MAIDYERFRKAFSGKRVFITGHTGFKGAWLSLWLSKLGAKVTGFSLNTSAEKSLFSLLQLDNTVQSILGDINDYAHLEHEVITARPEIVFHFAAQPIVLESYEHPLQTIQTNVMGSVNLMEILRKSTDLKALVVATSDKCYRKTNQKVVYKETDALGGRDPYSASKGALEILVESYYHSFFSPWGIGVGTGRVGNVIGGGDFGEHRLIPDAIRSFAKKQTVEVRNPDHQRPWQHVLEALSGYLFLAQHLCENPEIFSGSWNFGPSAQDSITVVEVIKMLCASSGGAFSISKISSSLHEDRYLHLSSEKASSKLHWKPHLTPQERIEKTWAWYDEYLSGALYLRKLTEEQIEAFEEKLFLSQAVSS